MTQRSTDYHDYVFQDGRLVADFEAMYRYSATVPWHQDRQADWVDIRLTVDLLQDFGPFDEIYDLGCGLGHYLDLMRRAVGRAQCRAVGFDISETACIKARNAFPAYAFDTLDLTDGNTRLPIPPAGRESNPNRLFMIRATLWYVFPKLDIVVQTIRSLMAADDRLLVVQNFPPLDRDFIGKDVIPNYAELIRHFSRSFSPVRHLWYEDAKKSANDNWFVGLFETAV